MYKSNFLRILPVFLAALIIIFTSATAPVAKAEDNFCTRENLKSLANKYFKAIQAHKPSMMPLASNVRFTENGIEKKVGEGFWQTAGKALLTRHLIDTCKCGTNTLAVVEEPDQNGKVRPILFGVRLQYKDNKITEIETIIAREKEFAFTMGGAKSLLKTIDQDWESILPPKSRSSRLAMAAAANDYFDMFAKEPIVHTPFADECDRWENGVVTTMPMEGFPFPDTMKKHDCSPTPTGLVMKHPPRRVPLVDVEAGIAVAYVHFAGGLPDFHLFKIVDGKVKWIQAIIGSGAKSTGWPNELICDCK